MQNIVYILSLAVVVLALGVPAAFYLGFRQGQGAVVSEADRIERFASNALETMKASSATDKAQADTLRARDEILRKQLLESFNNELQKTKQQFDEELEVMGQDGTVRKIRAGNLEPVSPAEARHLEQIS
jgi:hypothetical protein